MYVEGLNNQITTLYIAAGAALIILIITCRGAGEMCSLSYIAATSYLDVSVIAPRVISTIIDFYATLDDGLHMNEEVTIVLSVEWLEIEASTCN